VTPDVRKSREVGVVILLVPCVVPKSDGHGRKRSGTDQFAFFVQKRAPVLIVDFNLQGKCAALNLAFVDGKYWAALREARDDVGTARDGRQLDIRLYVAINIFETLR
jgi:hypothetical protein